MLEMAVVVYDVPISERALYNKLRNKIKRVGIPMTSSVYLFPFGLRDTVKAILADIESQKPNVIASNVIKFDPSEEKNLIAAAERGLNQIIKNAHNLMMKRLQKAEDEQVEVEERLKLLEAKKDSSIDLLKLRAFADENFILVTKKAMNQAEKALKDSRRLATLFMLSNQLEVAFVGFEELIKHQRELAEAKLNLEKAQA